MLETLRKVVVPLMAIILLLHVLAALYARLVLLELPGFL